MIPIAPYNLDPNVDVIYICPVKATEEFVEYYMKLINIICSVNNLSYEQVKEKIKFITPEHFDRFPVSYYIFLTLDGLLFQSPFQMCSMVNDLKFGAG